LKINSEKIIYLIFRLLLINIAWSQKVYVASDGVVRITPTVFVHAGGEVEVIAGGDLTTTSDVTESGSFILSDSTTGNITCKR
jgi:hypothetical protein|tara:strand:- start:746 stop:994 length:249 start_codon:yes stop_codon:yes gene_type:complete